MTQNPEVSDLLLIRQMQRQGAGLSEIGEVLDRSPAETDLFLWRWFGASAGQPTPRKRAMVA